MKQTLKALFLITLALLLAGLLGYLFRVQLLTGLARFLIVNEPIQPADIIFILNGDAHTRPFRAAELFQQGLAPQIVIPREENSPAAELGLYPNGTDVSVNVLKKLGVPEQNIVIIPIEGGVTSTRDEAVALRRYAAAHGLQRVIVVTSSFHTRRARWIIARTLSGSSVTFAMAAVPEWKFDDTNWWREERGLISLTNEYIKLVYYWARY
jgi:uncharacterized SAM-binding protein YcdF (DUF218 family)